MKTSIQYLLVFGNRKIFTLCILLILIGCSKDDIEVDNTERNPAPEGAKIVTIEVDKAYDLSNTDANSIMGSVSMKDDNKNIFVPDSIESAIFFLKEGTNEVLAVVRTSPINNTITVNANTVAQALMTLVPAYHSLSKVERYNFEKEALSVKSYADFVTTVDLLLKEGKSVYSTEPEYINQLVELNSYINDNYFDISVQAIKNKSVILDNNPIKQSEDNLEFMKWMSRKGGGTLTNQVHSYVSVEFAPNSGGKITPSLLKPKPVASSQYSQLLLPSLELRDDCYKVYISQTPPSVKEQNLKATATNFIELFFSLVFEFNTNGQDMNACITAITASAVTDLSTTVMNFSELPAMDIVENAGWVIWNASETFLGNDGCTKTFLNPKKIIISLAKQSATILKVIKAIDYAKKIIEITSCLNAIIDPLELDNIIQLYHGNLKEACVKVVQDGSLDEAYAPGAVVYPGIILEAHYQYAEWVKSSFKVKWVVEQGNGFVDNPISDTNSEGKATVAWTLPDNRSGEVTLKAEILDKEGNHLTGSPQEYSTTIADSISYYMKIIPGIWICKYEALDYATGSLYIHQIDIIELFSDGTGKRISTEYYNSTFYDHAGKTDDPYYFLVWGVKRQNGSYVFSFYDQRWRQTSYGMLTPQLDIVGKLGTTFTAYLRKK